MDRTMNHQDNLPDFTQINIDEIESTLDKILAENRSQIAKIIESKEDYTWDDLLAPIEDLEDNLHQYWSLVSHMNSVVNSNALREVYNKCLPKLSGYGTELSHNKKLYAAIKSVTENEHFSQLHTAQKKSLKDSLRDFKLSGVSLNADKKEEFAHLVKDLSKLTTKFEENVLDATQAWVKQITDEKQLVGLPDHAIASAKKAAEDRKKEGWVFTLEFPSYHPVMTYADDRALREAMYTAYVTRASDQGPNAGQNDNSTVMLEILKTRSQLAHLLGFDNYAEKSLATKMVKQTDQVIDFLNKLAKPSLPRAKEEFKELYEFAEDKLQLENIQAWDIGYASEKLRLEKYSISQEEVRPYFPEQQVVTGLFSIVKKLYGIRVEKIETDKVWHKDVSCYALYDKENVLRSYFYFDLYARENKRGGAWMDDCRSRRLLKNGDIQIPIAFVTCNFGGPVGSDPALFTHDEVETLFHEFGHALQHMLTTVNYFDVAGINGIPWDAVELASQFLENWCWEKDSIKYITKHYKTSEPLPDYLFKKMRKAKNFQSAMQMMRQIEFSLFDFLLHREFDSSIDGQVQSVLNAVREKVAVIPAAPFNRFQHGFSHIFAGGYAAGYYSYKWAEVMASDAFSLFEEKGIFDAESAQRFLTYILEPGGSEEPEDLYHKFRGRLPKVEALLKQTGIIQ
jgi:oligopeptidase A